jgi:hypothetical protein
VVTHRFELADGVVAHFLRVEAGEVVAAGIMVGAAGRGDAMFQIATSSAR